MKKFILSFVLVLSSIVMFAQGNMREVVYLKNGSVIKGVILEQIPNESIKIQTADGSIFVYPMADVEKIAKEVVETQVQPQVQQNAYSLGGLMERDGRDLVINGRELSEAELKTLLSDECYETYMSAKSQYSVGRAFSVVFFVSLGLTVAGTVAYSAAGGEPYVVYACAGIADISLPLMCIFKGIGKGRINWVAEEYNRTKGNSYSFNVTPSIMKCNTPGATSSVVPGMTLSLNF